MEARQSDLTAVLSPMKDNPQRVRFADLYKVCEHHFRRPRHRGTLHVVFKMPWLGDPRVNIQDDKGQAKPYQVRQVLEAIDKNEGL